MPSKWSEIPTEIFLLIFKPIHSVDLCNSSLVCRNWNRQLEPSIYSFVMIRSASQQAQFNDTLVNSDKGGLVKGIGFTYDYHPGFANLYRTTLDHLPRLQDFRFYAEFSYWPLIDALKRGQLAELKYMNDPVFYDWGDLDNYGTCVMLIKDRLEHFDLFDNTMDGKLRDWEEIDNLSCFYERMSQIMEQPHSFTEISVRKKINDNITYAESILKKCIHLKTLNLTVEDDFLDEETSQWTSEMIRNRITPIKTIKSLSVFFTGANIDAFVYYLCYKF